MGCFDTVRFKCPSCGSNIEVQSKGGACRMKHYPGTRTPLGVADYILGDKVTCSHCHKELEVQSATEYVSLFLEEVVPMDEDDY